MTEPIRENETPRLAGFPDELTTRMAVAVARGNNLDTVAEVIEALKERLLKAESQLRAVRSPSPGGDE